MSNEWKSAHRHVATGVQTWILLALVLIVFLPATGAAQALYGSVTGTVTDTSGSVVPGVSVSITNEGTGLALSTTTDERGAYTIRNVIPGTYTLKASLEGFREHVRTGIPVTPGGIVRMDALLEIGALTESVVVTTETALLRTDKADVSIDLRPEDVTNLPLNQYRNYQYLMNLAPGVTPPRFQNAQTDTPGRALTVNVNGTNRNNNVTRIDGAASINIFLPHHAGYIAPAETIENVNISTNSFDASQGMTGGAATVVTTKSGTNELRGSTFYFRSQDEFNARRGYFDPEKLDASVSILGGTIGGPIVRNRLFYFGSWERNLERNSFFQQLTVPTERMRNGDFGEVLAFNPRFRIYDPATGNPDGTGRSFFPNAVIPADRINDISRRIQQMYPLPNNPGTNNGLQNNLFLARRPKADRDNFDVKINWNRTSEHQLWAKFSMMDAEVSDLFHLGINDVGTGFTETYIWTVGQTWTLSPTLLLDGNVSTSSLPHIAQAGDFGTNFGLEVLGIPGTNSAGVSGPGSEDPRWYSGVPRFNTGLATLGQSTNWTPVWREERTYTASANLTKVAGNHEVRAGFDFIRMQMDHWQPEQGNPRGAFSFDGDITGTPGYAGVGGWNGYAAFLLGQVSDFNKSVQFEVMSGRENQYGLYISDRWDVSNKLTLNLGLRYEYYPLMMRENRGLEVFDPETFDIRLGGLGGNPDDLGIGVSKTLFAPRVGVAYRLNEDTVFRAGYGKTFNPLPWSRPFRGFYPAVIAYSDAGPNPFVPYATINEGLPDAPVPDLSAGTIPLPRGVDMRWPDPDDSERGSIRSWNVFVERRLPLDIAASVGYVGTRTDGGYADWNLNYAESGGTTNRQFFEQAGTAAILHWAARTRTRYHALQVAINRPLKNGLLLKGAYTLSKAMNETDDDGWAGLTWNQPSQMHRNYALAGYDRPHMFQMGFVYQLPFGRQSSSPLALLVKDWQVNGIGSWVSGTPFSVGGDNGLLQQVGGFQSANVTGEPKGGFGEAGPDEPWYDPSLFSQPGNAWGNSGRNAFRGPANWNLDLSVFRTIAIGDYGIELRAETQNVFNHPQWGNPITGLTNPNFMRIRSLARLPRTVQLGARVRF